MNSESEKFEWIENYLNGTLTEEQQVAFENKMHTDLGFAEELELHRTVNELVIDQALLDLKAKMVTEYRPKYRDNDLPGSNPGNTFIVIGLVVLSALTASIFYFKSPSSTPLPVATEKVQPLSLPQPANSSGLNPSPGPAPVLVKSQPDNGSNKPKGEKKISPLKIISPIVDSSSTSEENGLKMELVLPLEERPLVIANSPGIGSGKTKLIIPRLVPSNLPNDKEPTDALFDCSSLKMAVKVSVQESCLDFPNGKISYDPKTVEGGEPPYRFSLDNGLSFTKANQFEALSPGIYYLTIEDKRGCQYTLEEGFEVKPGECNETKEYAFAPEQGETCKFLFAQNRDGHLQIFNREGVLIYSISIRNGFPIEWNGQSNQGVGVTMGSYRFIFEDLKGKTTRGNITLVK